MALRYSAAVRTARMTSVLTAIDAGSTAGTLEITTAAYGTVLASFPLGGGAQAKPSGVVSGDTLTLSNFPKTDSSVDATGTAALARIKDASGNVIIDELTVGTSGTHIVLNTVSLTAGQQITINSASITHG